MMDRTLNREILRLSLPSILANLTVPLVGFVDTAIAGHLPGGSAAAYIGAVSVGALLFNLIYWNFGFLRTGSGGLTAQAFGKGDMHECAAIFVRGIVLSLVTAALTLCIQRPFMKLALLCTQASGQVESFASRYFLIRIWAAPATLSLMVFSGWFVGMQDSVSSMWKDLVVNGVNIVASIALSFGCPFIEPLGFDGVAWGTVVAQYSGLLYCIVVCSVKYGRKVFSTFRLRDLRDSLGLSELRNFFRMNLCLFGRSLGFTAIYMGYTLIATAFGDTILACSSILMQVLMVFSYFTDGFAYAGEALSGRFIGAGTPDMLRRTVHYVFVWSMSIAVLFVAVYAFAGKPMVSLLTDDSSVVEACSVYLPWLLLMPPLGCAAFTWDGIFLGATRAWDLFISMAGATVLFFAVWFLGRLFIDVRETFSLHLLMAAYFAHLLFRMIWLTIRYPRIYA